LATGAGDNSVRSWDLTAGTQQTVLAPTGRIGVLAASPDRNWIATGSPGNEIKLWNANSGEPRGALTGHDAEVAALAFSPKGDRLASGDTRGHVRLWRLESRAAGRSSAWTLDRELLGNTLSLTSMRLA